MSRHRVREIDGVRVGMQASKIKFHKRYAVYHPDHHGDMEQLQEVIVDSITTVREEDGPSGITKQVVKARYVDPPGHPEGPWEGHPNDLLGTPDQFKALVDRAAAARKARNEEKEALRDLAATAIKMLQSVGLNPRYRDYSYYRDRDEPPRPVEFEFDTVERIQALVDWMREQGVPVPNDITLEKMER